MKRAAPRGFPLKKPTIRVVAAKAGVAVSTVSRYLNDDSVSRPMKAHLSRVIESLGFKPSRTARNLSLGLKGCIGVVVDSIQDPWFTQLLTGMEEELQSRDISLMLLSLELRDTYDPSIAFEWIDERRVDGLIIAKCHRRDRTLVRAALDAQLPIIAVAPDETLKDVAVLRADNVAAGRTLGAHLADLGHTRIAFAGGPSVSVESRHRLQGLRDELRTRGIPMRKEDVCFCASYDAEDGAAYAETFLRQPKRPTAVVLGSDALAIGFIRAAQQRGVEVPGELSVAAFDGIPEGARSWPGLTTMAQPMREMGRDACRRLFTAINAVQERAVSQYSMTLVVRESTAAPRTVSQGRRRKLLAAVTLVLALCTGVIAQEPRLFSREWYSQFTGAYSRPVQPFRIVGNIYYVGAENIASYLIATPQGHILIDSGTAEMHDAIVGGIEALGYKPSDVRVLLASHAHFDHIEGHALMQRRTGAQVVAMQGDAEALESGHDTSALGAMGWEPVRVSRRLKDGDSVELGGTTLRAIHAPGHTQGATIWMTTVEDGGRRYSVAFFTTTTPNPGVALFDNPRHKNVIDDTRRTFRKLKAERAPDIVLVGHPQAMFAQTMERMRRGERPHPLLNGAEAWTRQLATAEADFERRVAQEQSRR